MKLLLGVDLHEESDSLVIAAADWAVRLGGRLDLAYCDPFRTRFDYVPDAQTRVLVEAELARMADSDIQRLKRLEGLVPEAQRGALRVLDGNPGEALPKAGEDYDLVVVGTHGRTGLEHLWMGSVAERVVRHSPKPVLVVRPRHARTGRMLVGVDVADSGTVVAHAAEWGQRLHLRTDVIYVEPPPNYAGAFTDPALIPAIQDAWQKQSAMYKEAIENSVQQLPSAIRGQAILGNGSPHVAIAESSPAYDLVVCATHGRGGVAHFLIGSVAERVVRHAQTSVLMVRL